MNIMIKILFIKLDLEFANGFGNNRKVQDLNGRDVKKGNTECEE